MRFRMIRRYFMRKYLKLIHLSESFIESNNQDRARNGDWVIDTWGYEENEFGARLALDCADFYKEIITAIWGWGDE